MKNIVVHPFPCPFCGAVPQDHPQPTWKDKYFACFHKSFCFIYITEELGKPFEFTLIPRNSLHISAWNTRCRKLKTGCKNK